MRVAVLALLLATTGTACSDVPFIDDEQPVCAGPGGCAPPDTGIDDFVGTWKLALAPSGVADPCPTFEETRALDLDVSADAGNLALAIADGRALSAVNARTPSADADAHVTFTLSDRWGAIDGVPVNPAVDYDLTVDRAGHIEGTATALLFWDTPTSGTACHFDYLVAGDITAPQ
jgi:hypothetical protein